MKKVLFFSISIISLNISDSSYLLARKSYHEIGDRTEITSISIEAIAKPRTLDELRKIIISTKKPISLAGARYSQGGQIAYPGGCVIDMSAFDNIISFDKAAKRITVQAGATWRKIQEYIDPHDLSLKVMQSYNDFSLGGSLSVNVHGRDMRCGPLISTVESITILLADGRIVQADRLVNNDLFYGAIGGYGLLGVIIDATLSLTENERLQKYVQLIDFADYPHFFNLLQTDPSVVFQNADVFPMNFQQALSVTWRKTDKALTVNQRLQSGFFQYIPRKVLEILVRWLPFLKKTRPVVEILKGSKKMVVTRNHEMSYHIQQLAMDTNHPTTTTLQEYFVPCRYYQEALTSLSEVLNNHDVNVMNLSVRFVPQDTESLLSYAGEDCFSFVLYITIFNTDYSKRYLQKWTRELITKLLPFKATFYLPYIICARKKQFKQAYPTYKKFLEVKKKYDPKNKFRNMLWKTYFEGE